MSKLLYLWKMDILLEFTYGVQLLLCACEILLLRGRGFCLLGYGYHHSFEKQAIV